MDSAGKEIKEKAEKVQELLEEWKKALKSKDKDKLSKISYEILKLGEELMKKIWHTVRPGDRLSDVANAIAESETKTEIEK
ncbi:hypothetical protein HRbin19_00613 [bacterium HR19]|nr:hypothetical protein HRbin19_00613 [bacterium HR19]